MSWPCMSWPYGPMGNTVLPNPRPRSEAQQSVTCSGNQLWQTRLKEPYANGRALVLALPTITTLKILIESLPGGSCRTTEITVHIDQRTSANTMRHPFATGMLLLMSRQMSKLMHATCLPLQPAGTAAPLLPPEKASSLRIRRSCFPSWLVHNMYVVHANTCACTCLASYIF
jgi:hypothetical protein